MNRYLLAAVFTVPMLLYPWGPWWGVLTLWLVAFSMALTYGQCISDRDACRRWAQQEAGK